MTIGIGDKLPDLTLKVVTADGPVDKSTAEVFGGKKVVLFGVPGAFTGVCSGNHLPGYLDNLDAIKAKGVDEVICLAVNDASVMKAWATHTGSLGKLGFIADGSDVFTKAVGLEIDLNAFGMGVRSKRYSAIVEDGVVKSLNIEDTPGTAVASGAAKILEQL